MVKNDGQIQHPGAILKVPNLKSQSYAKCKAIDRNFKNYNFKLTNGTTHLLGMLIFLLGYTDYDLDYKRQGIY